MGLVDALIQVTGVSIDVRLEGLGEGHEGLLGVLRAAVPRQNMRERDCQHATLPGRGY